MGHVQISVGNLGLPAEIFSRNFVSNTTTGPSPDNSALMNVEMPKSDAKDNIYETDASSAPPLIVYISDVIPTHLDVIPFRFGSSSFEGMRTCSDFNRVRVCQHRYAHT